MRTWLLKILFPLVRRIGYIRLTWKAPDCAGVKKTEIEGVLRQGYVALSFKHGCLTNLFIPGELNHAAVAISGSSIVEAVPGEGVRYVAFRRWLKRQDRVVVLRPKFCGDEGRRGATVAAVKLIGKPYDWLFRSKNKAFYCSEVVYFCYAEALGRDECPLIKSWLLGETIYTPGDIISDRHNWEIVKVFGRQKGQER